MTNREYLQWLLSPVCKQRPPWRVNHLAVEIGVDRQTLTKYLRLDDYKPHTETERKISVWCDSMRAKV